MNDFKEYLNIAILQESKPVTYKSLARSLGIHVNTAKQALYEFANENQASVHAIYCITGTSIKNDQFSIQLVKASELEETKKTYKQITGVHVYSVTSFETTDFTLLYSACKEMPKLSFEDRIKCGALKNDSVSLKKTATPAEVKKPVTAESNPFAKASISKPTSSTSTAASKKSTPAAPAKRKGTLQFGPATSKKQAVMNTESEGKLDPVSKPVVDNKKKAVPSKSKNDHDDIEKRMAKTSINKNPQIFSSDEENEDDDEEEKEQVQMNEVQEDEPVELGDEGDIMEDVEETKEKDEDDSMNPPSTAPNATAPRGNAKKKVLKKKTTRNARGLLVTEEVWEWESVDEEEEDNSAPPPIKSKAAASTTNNKSTTTKNAKKPAAAAGGGGQQTNLFSFFKKN